MRPIFYAAVHARLICPLLSAAEFISSSFTVRILKLVLMDNYGAIKFQVRPNKVKCELSTSLFLFVLII